MSVLERVLRKSQGDYALSCMTIDDEGQPLIVTDPALVVVDGAGTSVFTGTPTVTEDGLSAAVPVEDLPLLDTYTATWTAVSDGDPVEWETTIELVGGHLFSLAQLRARDSAFVDDTRYPASQLAEARVVAEDAIEGPKAACVAFVPRGRRASVNGTGLPVLRVPDFEVREIYAITVDGTAWDVADVTVDDNRLVLASGATWPAGTRNVDVHYAHGRDRAPAPISRAGLTLAREFVLDTTSEMPSRATALTTGDQTYRLTIAGRDGVTGIPDVDAAIDQHGRKKIGYA